jgi:PST family polysaccharide transporter
VSSDPVRVRSAFLKTIRLVMLISVPACLGIALTSDLVTRLLLGEKWIDAAPYLTLMSISVLAMPFAQTINSVSLSLDRPQVMFRINLIDCIIRTSLITLAFYFYSVDGAIYARLVIAAIMFAVYLSQVRDLVGLGVKQQLLNLWKVAFAGAAMTIAVLWLRSKLDGTDVHHVVQLVLISTFGAAAYGLALLALGVRLRLGLGPWNSGHSAPTIAAHMSSETAVMVRNCARLICIAAPPMGSMHDRDCARL